MVALVVSSVLALQIRTEGMGEVRVEIVLEMVEDKRQEDRQGKLRGTRTVQWVAWLFLDDENAATSFQRCREMAF